MMNLRGTMTLKSHYLIAPAGQYLLTAFVGRNRGEETTSTGEML